MIGGHKKLAVNVTSYITVGSVLNPADEVAHQQVDLNADVQATVAAISNIVCKAKSP